jgi:hypothetical protein
MRFVTELGCGVTDALLMVVVRNEAFEERIAIR